MFYHILSMKSIYSKDNKNSVYHASILIFIKRVEEKNDIVVSVIVREFFNFKDSIRKF